MKVAIFGATGETGQSIVKGLLDSSEHFDITALVRPSQPETDKVSMLRSQGVEIVPVDLKSSPSEVVPFIVGIEVIICSVLSDAVVEQQTLATAAKEAGVARFVPSFWGPVMPAKGISKIREAKEDILDHIKRLYLPYTAIDIGWWTQLSVPRLPSGKIDSTIPIPMKQITGNGDTETALVDLRDIGRFVARIIVDSRTLNRMVFAYGEIWTQNQIWDLLRDKSGEEFPKVYQSADEILENIRSANEDIKQGSTEFQTQLKLNGGQYMYSWGIRGDNTPACAKYLGYLDAKELYPDLQASKLQDYIDEILDGSTHIIYEYRQDWKSLSKE